MIFLIILLKKKKDFIYLIPFFQVVVDASFTEFSVLGVATFYRASMILLFLIYCIKYFKKSTLVNTIYLFLFFCGLLVLNSDEFLYSFKNYAQVVLSMLMFPVGFSMIDQEWKFDKLLKSLISVIVISLIFVISGYFFKIGRSLEYTLDVGAEDVIGLLSSGGLFSSGVAIGLLPVILPLIEKDWKRKTIVILTIILYIFIILNVRRTAIIIPLIGVGISLIFMNSKKKLVVGLVTAILIFILLLPTFEDILISRIDLRESQRNNEMFTGNFYQNEQRYWENIILFDKILKFNDPKRDLFGIDNNIFAEHIMNNQIVTRMYHTDIAKLLYGTGLLGLLLYFIIIIGLLVTAFKYKDKKFNKYFLTSFILTIITIFVIFNGSLNLITFRSIIFLVLGASVGMQMRTYNAKYLVK